MNDPNRIFRGGIKDLPLRCYETRKVELCIILRSKLSVISYPRYPTDVSDSNVFHFEEAGALQQR
jgi:hypothetical protein